jgi:catechol 2,3-dioxygenase-like lactoylglutathione lyase family enzyme
MSTLANPKDSTTSAQTTSNLALEGVHHTARPTWKLAETVHFYRDVMGLKICHAITAKGWGPEDHPDFLHFFFESGNGSTIAFFYYLGSERPADAVPWDHWLYRSVHTAWRVLDRRTLIEWKERLESFGYKVMVVRHEILESIYVTDPNDYMIEISWQMRPLGRNDAVDATLTLEAAIDIEKETSRPVQVIDDIWRAKSRLVEEHAALGADPDA